MRLRLFFYNFMAIKLIVKREQKTIKSNNKMLIFIVKQMEFFRLNGKIFEVLKYFYKN